MSPPLKAGDYVMATVRRPGKSNYDVIGADDMTTDDTYFERGINLRHGYLTESYVDDAELIVKVPKGLKHDRMLWSLRPWRKRKFTRHTRFSAGSKCGDDAHNILL